MGASGHRVARRGGDDTENETASDLAEARLELVYAATVVADLEERARAGGDVEREELQRAERAVSASLANLGGLVADAPE